MRTVVVDWVGRYLHVLGLPDLEGTHANARCARAVVSCPGEARAIRERDLHHAAPVGPGRRGSAARFRIDLCLPGRGVLAVACASTQRRRSAVCSCRWATRRGRRLRKSPFPARIRPRSSNWMDESTWSTSPTGLRSSSRFPSTRRRSFGAGLAWRFRREGPDMLVQDRLIEGTWTPFCHYALPAATAVASKPPTSDTTCRARALS